MTILRAICPGYAALNLTAGQKLPLMARTPGTLPRVERLSSHFADGDGVVQSVRVIDPGRAPTGGPIPPRDAVEVLLDDGAVLELSFQMVCIPALRDRPRLMIEPGERVRVWADKQGPRVVACIWSSDGDLIAAAACLQPVASMTLGGELTLAPGKLRRSGGDTWEHDIEVRWGELALTLPAGGWHRLEGRADLTGMVLRAELPSAQMSHLRFGLLARR